MVWRESNPLPKTCAVCKEEDCYNCEFAGVRWHLSEEDELKVKRKMLERHMEQLQRKIAEIDRELEKLEQ